MTYDVRSIDEELAACDLQFAEQCKIIWEGLKKGVKHDGCTGVPDFKVGICCGEHDTHYQLADVSRWEADKRLFKCILKKGVPSKIWKLPYNSNWFLATTFWVGVCLIGWKFYRRKRNVEIADVDRDVAGP